MTNNKTTQEGHLPSIHIFLLPFSYQLKDDPLLTFSRLWKKVNSLSFENKTYPIDWKRVTQDQPTVENYSEYVYFHPFAQEALYDIAGNDSIRHYKGSLRDNSMLDYIINVDDERSYSLNVNLLSLNLYSTGVGILSIHTQSNRPMSPDEILAINQYGRRIYKPYSGSKGVLIPQSVGFRFKNDKTKPVSVLETFDGIQYSRNIDLPKHISGILPSALNENCHLHSALDDRMFVLSWYANDDIASKVYQTLKPNTLDADDFLYRFIFVDRPGKGNRGVSNPQMRKQLIEDHTYQRWIEDECIYGICRYAFVAIGPSSKDWIQYHVSGMYYKMVELCLMQRASLLQFSRKIAAITHQDNPRKRTKKTSQLNQAYLHFHNNIYFKEITPQEQGIELYDLLQQHLRIEEQANSLNQEIQELHNFVSLTEEKQRNRSLDMLTVLGALFVVPSFILGYYSLGILNENIIPRDHSLFNRVFFSLLVIGLSGVIANVLLRDIREFKNKKLGRIIGKISLLISIITTIYLLVLPYRNTPDQPTLKNKIISDTLKIKQPINIQLDSTHRLIIDPK